MEVLSRLCEKKNFFKNILQKKKGFEGETEYNTMLNYTQEVQG